MSSEKYATEENIRTLITLFRDELKNYVKKEDYVPGEGGGSTTTPTPGTTPDLSNYVTKSELEKYVTWDEFNEAIKALPGGAGIRFETIYSLPDEGEPGVIYLLYSNGEGETNQYNEYIWDADEQRFEMFGPAEGASEYVTWEAILPMFDDISSGGSLNFEVVDDGELPISGQTNTIYLLPKTDGGDELTNKYDEYIWIENEGRFELVGTDVNAPGE